MDRQRIERSIKGLSEWQMHVQAESDIDANISTAIEALKAQLSKEGTTKDTISKTETVEHLRRMLEATVPNTDYDEGFVDGVEFGVSTVSTMPTIQPVATGTDVGDTISRQASAELVMKYCPDDDGAVQCDGDIRGLLDELENLPPAQPEPQEGEWIKHESPDGGEQYECSRCGVLWEFNDGTPEDNEAYFCPKCGTKMKRS